MQATASFVMKSITRYGNGLPAEARPLSCSTAACQGTVLLLSGSLPRGSRAVTAVTLDAAGNSTTSAPITSNR